MSERRLAAATAGGDRDRRQHGGGEQHDLRRDGLAVEERRQCKGDKGLQQLDLRNPRDAAYRNYCDRVSRAFRDGRDDRQAAYDEYIERVTTVRDDSLKAAYRDRANYLANALRTNR